MSVPFITVNGRAVKDAQARRTNEGKPFVTVRVAASDSKKLDDGSWQTMKEVFFDVVWWDADTDAYLPQTGDSVRVSGKLYQEFYETKDGEERLSIKLDADVIKAWPKRQGDGGGNGGGQQQGGRRATVRTGTSASRRQNNRRPQRQERQDVWEADPADGPSWD